MKKKIVLSLFAILLTIVWIGESRSFFCIGDGMCVTVWKTYGGTCYVVPGKYYGLTKPVSRNHIRTTNASGLDIIWPNDSKNIVVDINDSNSLIINDSKGVFIIDYSSKRDYFNSLFTYFDGKYHRYKKDVAYISLSIPENVAVDNTGNKL